MGISDQFAKLGASLVLLPPRTGWRNSIPDPHSFSIDINEGKKGETFVIRAGDKVQVQAVDVRKDLRHLLLFVNNGDFKSHYLCGHDERHWFVAAIPGGANSIVSAMEKLKPTQVIQAETNIGLKKKDKNKRHNAAWLRQGEWYFIPATANTISAIDERLILKNEPLQRGRGKPHLAQELYRIGGEQVYVRGSEILTAKQYADRSRAGTLDGGNAWRKDTWRMRMRNPTVYVRGGIKHPDHATLKLKGWHRVLPNTETAARGAQMVDFID